MTQFYLLIKRSKLIHILFWIYSGLNLYHNLELSRGSGYLFNRYDLVNTIFYQMVATYLTIYVLVPQYFYRQKYASFFFGWVMACLLSGLGNAVTGYIYVQWISPGFQSATPFGISYLSHLVDLIGTSLIFLVVILIEHYIKREARNKTLEKERLENELKFLKAQMNPHFMFNALNNIYFLIDQDKEQSKDILLRFSALLRYQLYECSGVFTPLQAEMEFLKDYIAIETIRKGAEVGIHAHWPEPGTLLEIAPLMLIPFVENAFKHVSDKPGQPHHIVIQAFIDHNVFTFNVENSSEPRPSSSSGGLGVQNVKRRLELLYPQRHELSIGNLGSKFTVQLQIELQ